MVSKYGHVHQYLESVKDFKERLTGELVKHKLFWSIKLCRPLQQFNERISGEPSESKQGTILSYQIQIWDLREPIFASAKESNSKWGKIYATQIRQISAMIYLQVATEEEKKDEKVLLGNIYNDKV